MKHQTALALETALTLAALLAAARPANAATSSADSNVTAVDTRDFGIAVSGRVRAAQTGAALPGASVTLAGQNATAGADGGFALANVNLASGNTLTVSKATYASYSGAVNVPPGTTAFTVPDVLLQPAATGKPVVTGLQTKYDGIFLSAVSLLNDYTASVNWNGLAPDRVELYVNGTLSQSVPTSSGEATATLDMARGFFGSLTLSANKVKVIAVGGAGARSEPFEKSVTIIPMPSALVELAPGFSVQLNNGAVQYALDFDYPDPPLGAPLTLPFFGKFGAEVSVNGSFDYTLPDGSWELTLGYSDEFKKGKRGRRPTIPGIARYPKLHFYVGNKTVTARLAATLSGTALPASGITFDQLSVDAALDSEFELGHFGVTDIFLPGSTEALNQVPGLKDVVSSLQAEVTANLGAASKLKFDLRPQMQLRDGELTGSVGVEASYNPTLLGFVDAEFSAGGVVTVTIGVPNGVFKGLHGELYGEALFHSWIFTWPPGGEPLHAVFARFDIPGQSAGAMTVTDAPIWRVYRVKAVEGLIAEGGGLRPMSRSYLSAGPEGFLAGELRLKDASLSGTPPLEAFRQIGSAPVRGSVAGSPRRRTKDFGDLVGTNQVDLTLVQNAFPNSEPALTARGTELMLLYVTDNGITNNLQFTDIKWTRWDGTNWSVPLTIQTNTQAEFAPQVKYDGNGDAIAVWERVADPNFTDVDLTAMAAQMEIVWSRWSRTNGAWSDPVALTANNYLDHAPLLCGPMANGEVLLVWTRNLANRLMGSGPVGADENDRVMWSKWNPSVRSWSTPLGLASDLPYRLSQSLAGAGNHAVYTWTRDLDGALTNAADQEVFFLEYTNGVWGTTRQFTTNSLADKNVRAAVATNGDVYFVWQSDTNLVMSRNFSTNLTLVRSDSTTAGFADFALTVGPLGHLVLLWQEMSTNESDAHYSVYDPASGTWGSDALLTQDSPLERSFAPVWDAVGNLTVAYDKVQILYTNKTVTLEGGGTVTITNVPQPGRVDLVVTKRALVKDLALAAGLPAALGLAQAGDFSVQGVNYLPGDPLTLSATVRNAGNVAVSNVVVGFYDGNPDVGGVLLTNVVLPGWLTAATSAVASALWVVPEPAAPHVLYAVANRTNLTTEFNASNNVQSVSIGGTDLAVGLVSYRAETNGAVRVIAQVQNLGAPTATNSVLGIRRDAGGTPAPPLATANVPVLEPGRLAQVALDLPAGTQPAGEAVYRLFADDTHVVPDVNTNNNTAAFAVSLWIDSDGDGIPDSWMMQNFGHATGLASDESRAQDDADGDGMSNQAEYLAGTDPRDKSSFLRIATVAAGSTGTTNGWVQITWGSAANRLYELQRAATVNGVFVPLASHVFSTPPVNTYLDTTATNASQFFYRLRVE